MSNVPNGFHQAIVSATVFLGGITAAYLKFVVFDPASGNWTKLGALSAMLAGLALLAQAWTLRRALRIENDNPQSFKRTADLLTLSVGFLIASGVSLAAADIAGTSAGSIISDAAGPR